MEEESEFYSTPIGFSKSVKCRARYEIHQENGYYVCNMIAGTFQVLSENEPSVYKQAKIIQFHDAMRTPSQDREGENKVLESHAV
jgi:hypothetical protein